MASDQSQTDEEDLLLFDQLLDVSVCNEDSDLLSVCGSSILDSESLLGTHEDLEPCTTPTTKPSLPLHTTKSLQQQPLQQPSRELVCGRDEDQPCEEGRGDGAGVLGEGEEQGLAMIQLNQTMGFRYVPDLPEVEMPPLARGRDRGSKKGRGSKRSRPHQIVSEPSLLLDVGSPQKRQKRISDLRMMITANRQARADFTCTKQLGVGKKRPVRFAPSVTETEPPQWNANASPGTSTRPGTTNSPGTGTRPGTTNSPGTNTGPGTTTSRGTSNRLGTVETTTNLSTLGTSTSPGAVGIRSSPGALGLSFHLLPSQSIFVCRPALINKKPGGFSLGHLRQCPASSFSLNHLRS